MHNSRLILAAGTVIAAIGLSAAAQDSGVSGGPTFSPSAERVADAPQRTADQTSDSIHGAADRDTQRQVIIDPATTDGRDDDILAPRGTTAAPDAEGIRDTLGSVTEAAVKEGTFDDLVERLVDADRNRIGEADLNEERFKIASQRFREAWKARYSSDFEIESEELVFDDQSFMIRQHEIGGEARTAGEQLGDVIERTGEQIGDTVDRAVDRLRSDDANAEVTVRTEGETDDRADLRVRDNGHADADVRVRTPDRIDATDGVERDADRERLAGGDTNREPGRNVARVMIPASHGLPQASVELIREFPDSWKIDAPDHVTAEMLHRNLQRELDRLADNQAMWPDEPSEAQRLVAHAVLLAILDKDSQASGQAGSDSK